MILRGAQWSAKGKLHTYSRLHCMITGHVELEYRLLCMLVYNTSYFEAFCAVAVPLLCLFRA